MQFNEFWVARWTGNDKWSGEFEDFPTYEEAAAFMEQQVARRILNGEAYRMEVVRVSEVVYDSMSGCAR